jgi:hypothetical protein
MGEKMEGAEEKRENSFHVRLPLDGTDLLSENHVECHGTEYHS